VSVVLQELGAQKKVLLLKIIFLMFLYCFPRVTSHEVQNNCAHWMLPLHNGAPRTKDYFINIFLFRLWCQNETDHICES